MEPKPPVYESKPMNETDDQILDRIGNGQEEAFNLLVSRYKAKVYKYAFYLLNNVTDAEDVTQEAFVRAFINLHKFRREASFSTWLFRITANVGYQHIGKLIRQRNIKERVAKHFQQYDYNNSPSPEELTLKDEMSQVVFEALQKLKPKHKQVLILKEINGLDVLEVATICNVPEGTIKSRLNRARAELKNQIKRNNCKGGELDK